MLVTWINAEAQFLTPHPHVTKTNQKKKSYVKKVLTVVTSIHWFTNVHKNALRSIQGYYGYYLSKRITKKAIKLVKFIGGVVAVVVLNVNADEHENVKIGKLKVSYYDVFSYFSDVFYVPIQDYFDDYI